MRLNAIETALMHNPVRAWVQRHYEAPLLVSLGGRVDGMRVLEIGCGRGRGVEILLRQLGARHVFAFDLDHTFVAWARRRLSNHGTRVQLTVADATAIPAPDASFDAVFDFGVIHHVPAWRTTISEVHRVLRPGGRFFFEEVTAQALARWSYRTFLRHPTDDRFTAAEFLQELTEQRIDVRAATTRFFGDFVVGVGKRRPASVGSQ
jgi:ubiquinone/menaquinone biosynthesis C-methylase UbiE